jgi:nucleoside-diphosphate-sugar epimerase
MSESDRTSRTAVIAGVSGISGCSLAERLLAEGWRVYGIARQPQAQPSGVIPIAVDLGDAKAVRSALAGVGASHAFYCTWSRQATETDNCRVNGAMLENFLSSLNPAGLRHVALVTGAKHYYIRAAGLVADTPFREDEPRLRGENFYYVLEDVLTEHASRTGFSWSVHRPNTIIGYAIGNQMNLGVTLAVYGTICRETGAPFCFPGSRFLWGALSELTDADLLARHLAWAAVTDAARNQAFNVGNGDLFRWRVLWPKLAAALGVEAAGLPNERLPLGTSMADAGRIWAAIAARHGLRPLDAGTLAAWWHADGDLGREFECFTSMAKSRQLGFLDYCESHSSFVRLFERLRRERVIPALPADPGR